MKKEFRITKCSLFAVASFFLFACAKESAFNVHTAEPAPTANITEAKSYIVVLKQNPGVLKAAGVNPQVFVHASLQKIETRFQLGEAKHQFSAALHGGVYQMNEQQATLISQNENVAYVEEDQVIHVSSAQEKAPWGLDRIDQAALPLNQTYQYQSTGQGVTAYVIDTGILNTHNEFQGRASSGIDLVDNDNDATDCNGHGTHVAGTIGGATYGVAKNVKLVGVRVLDCNGSGSYSSVIAGVDWVTAHHATPAVANMSLGGPISQALEDAIANSIKSGVTYAVAAGNENQSACLSSPSRLKVAIKVGATTNVDARSSFSNFGECVDIFAPGSDIESAWATSNTATNTISGTSMATPHTVGVLALYLERNPNSTPEQVKAALLAGSVAGKVTAAGTGSPNRLLNMTFTGAPVPPPPPPVNDGGLRNGIASSAINGAKNSEKVLTVNVPTGAKNLVIEMSGGQPDADLYVKFGAPPTTSSYDCRPYTSTNNEKCSFPSPAPGVYYIVVRGYSTFSGVSVKATY